jgi:lactobin A/cerein 7B family class IIb bacteriocin
MHVAGNTGGLRPLTNAELEDVSGGVTPLVVVPAVVTWCIASAIGWGDPPIGMSGEQAVQAAGLGHLL